MDRVLLMDIKITHNAPDVAAAIAKSPETVLPEVDKAMSRGAVEVADEEKRQAPKARSELTNSIQIKAKPLEYTILAAARYAGWVHEGTKGKGYVPLAELIAWIRLKRITPRTPMSESSLAHLIQHKIFTRGTTANPFARRALEAKTDRLRELVQAGAATGLAMVRT